MAVPMHLTSDFEICKSVTRAIGGRMILPKNNEDLMLVLSTCRFTASHRLHGGIFSLLSHTPTFLCEKKEKCTAFLNDIQQSLTERGRIAFPLSELSSGKIKELGADSSEFDVILNKLNFASTDGLCIIERLLCGEVLN